MPTLTKLAVKEMNHYITRFKVRSLHVINSSNPDLVKIFLIFKLKAKNEWLVFTQHSYHASNCKNKTFHG